MPSLRSSAGLAASAVAICTALSVSACDRNPTIPMITDTLYLEYVAGDSQTTVPHGQAPRRLTVRVRDQYGNGRWEFVQFEGDEGSSFLDYRSNATTGVASVTWVINREPGTYHATATLRDRKLHFSVRLDASARVTLEQPQLRFNSLQQILPVRFRLQAGGLDTLITARTFGGALAHVRAIGDNGEIKLQSVSNGSSSGTTWFGYVALPFAVTVRQVPVARQIMIGSTVVRDSLIAGAGTVAGLAVRWVDSLDNSIADSAQSGVTWQSSNAGVVTIDSGGMLRVGEDGIATLEGQTPAGTFALPVRVWSLAAAQVSTNGETSCALQSDGPVVCWGATEVATRGGFSLAPREIGFGGFSTLTLGRSYGCGLRPGGAAACWGSNEFGQLGMGSTAASSATPRDVVGGMTFTALSSGNSHTCAIATDGSAWCWGLANGGTTGDGRYGGNICGSLQSCAIHPVAVASSRTFQSIAAGGSHACAVDTEGQAWCWGWNGSGQLGVSGVTCRGGGNVANDPGFPCAIIPQAVAGGRRFTTIAAGDFHTCGLTADGAAWCWGGNSSGQLGADLPYGDTTSVPRAVKGDQRFASISAGGERTCGITATGVGYCWGLMSFVVPPPTMGAPRSFSVIPPPPPPTPCEMGRCSRTPWPIPSGRRFRSLDAGLGLTCGVSIAGVTYCMGEGTRGDGSTSYQPLPAPGRVLFQRRVDP